MGIPVDRYLVPADGPVVPPGFDLVMQPLVNGLPAELRLDADLSVIVFAPTGDANFWRDAESSILVCAGDEDLAANPATALPVAATARAPVRLVVQRGGVLVGAVPLVIGVRRHVPDPGVMGTAIEIAILGYRIHAGTMRQAGDFGSFVRFAWRRADRGSNEYVLPRLAPRVAERFAGQLQSEVGASSVEGQ